MGPTSTTRRKHSGGRLRSCAFAFAVATFALLLAVPGVNALAVNGLLESTTSTANETVVNVDGPLSGVAVKSVTHTVGRPLDVVEDPVGDVVAPVEAVMHPGGGKTGLAGPPEVSVNDSIESTGPVRDAVNASVKSSAEEEETIATVTNTGNTTGEETVIVVTGPVHAAKSEGMNDTEDNISRTNLTSGNESAEGAGSDGANDTSSGSEGAGGTSSSGVATHSAGSSAASPTDAPGGGAAGAVGSSKPPTRGSDWASGADEADERHTAAGRAQEESQEPDGVPEPGLVISVLGALGVVIWGSAASVFLRGRPSG